MAESTSSHQSVTKFIVIGSFVLAGAVLLGISFSKDKEAKGPEGNFTGVSGEIIPTIPAGTKLSKEEDAEMLTATQKTQIGAPTDMIDASKAYTATLKTSMGDITVALNAAAKPQTVNNFVYLARLGFYNETIFHRVISGFMIQGGDPLGTGMGGPAYKFSDELTGENSNAKGTISMANSGPNTNGSQFFINLVDNSYLDTKHTVFGKVISGMEVVEAVGKTPIDTNDRPLTPVVITLAVIEEK